MRILIWIILFLSFSTIVKGTQCYSATNGNWESAGSWSCGRVPANGDTIYIQVAHTITVNTNNSTLESGAPVYIEVYGTLAFGNGDKLRLSCGSGVSLKEGPPAGRLVGAGGGGSSNQLEICGTVVWKASDGDKTGPLYYGTPLPVILLNFTAQPGDMTVTLNWSTASEINNSHFIIERSDDAVNFLPIGNVDGQGTVNTLSTYQYIDLTAPEGIVYYRLAQVDFNGFTSYSDMISLKNKAMATLSFYPNPSKGDLLLTGSFEGDVHISIYNMLGQSVFSSNMELTRGITPLPLYDRLYAGNFILRVESESGDILIQEKLIVK